MAQSVIGALRVNLGLDSANFMGGAKRVSPAIKAMRTQFLAVSAAASAFGAALSAAALKGASEIDRTAKAARRLDASIGAFRALETAAGEAGVPVTAVANDIQSMNREIANIGTSGNGARALERLGLTAGELAGIDADEKVARIADRVAALGLSAGEATAVLRDLGVRNREMALLMIGGGDAIRRARADVEDYGLALSAVEAGSIEQANDRIGRLGYISQYAGQQLALALVPAMGRLAEAMTDSLREGGLLRGVLDAIADNVVRLSTYVATAAAAFGVRYVGALVAARLATATLSGTLLVLRGALIRTGIGALVVGAGELVYQFLRLVTAAGGFGEAMSLMRDVAVEVWERIKLGGEWLTTALKIVFNDIRYDWAVMVGNMATDWGRLLDGIASTKIGEFMGFEGGNAEAAMASLGKTMSRLNDAYGNMIEGQRALSSGMRAPLDSLQAMRQAVIGATEDADSAAAAAARLDEALAGAEGGGKSGGGGAASGAEKLKDKLSEVEQKARSASETLRQSFTGTFKEVLSGAKTFGEGVMTILQKITDMMLDQVGNLLFSGVSDWLGNAMITPFASAGNLPGFANGTDSAPGGLAWVGERGRELVNLPSGSQVIPHHKIRQSAGPRSVAMSVDPVINMPINIETLPGETAEVTRTPEGGMNIRMVRQVMRNELASGSMDSAMRQRWGGRPLPKGS